DAGAVDGVAGDDLLVSPTQIARGISRIALFARADGEDRADRSGATEVARPVQWIDGHQIGSARRGKRFGQRPLFADQASTKTTVTQSRDQDVVGDPVELAHAIPA